MTSIIQPKNIDFVNYFVYSSQISRKCCHTKAVCYRFSTWISVAFFKRENDVHPLTLKRLVSYTELNFKKSSSVSVLNVLQLKLDSLVILA